MFFDSTPDFLYPDFKVPGKYKLSKNLFRRIRIRDSFNAVYASSNSYTINDGETPDSIAYDRLGGTEWYWTILLLNNITDLNNQWPLDSDEIEKLINKKYGNLADKTRHWETSEVKDSSGNIVLDSGVIIEVFADNSNQNKTNYVPQIKDPAGGSVTGLSLIDGGTGYITYNNVAVTNLSGGGNNLAVDVVDSSLVSGATDASKISNLTISNNDRGSNYKEGDVVRIYGGNATAKVTSATNIWTDWFYDYIDSYNPIVIKKATAAINLNKVTNREYEYQLNELKREIYLPKKSILPIMQSELENLMQYDTKYKITKEGYRMSEEV